MRMESGVSLRSVRADWLRVESEVAWLRMLFSAHVYKQALDRQQKFNPYHDEAGRFTTAEGAVAGGAGQDGRVRVAQAGGRGRGGVGRGGVTSDAILPIGTTVNSYLQNYRPYAASRVRDVLTLDPNWPPPQSVSAGNRSPEAELRQHIDTILAAEARLEELGVHIAEPLRSSAELGRLGMGEQFGPGPYARESIPARGSNRDFTPGERQEINRIGREYGCHTCGARRPGTNSGNYVPDHQPPTGLNRLELPQRLFPHCLSCSREQGLGIAREKWRR